MRTSFLLPVGFFAAALFGAACSKQTPPPSAPSARPVTVVTTRAEDVPAVNEHLGRVAPFNSIEVRARVQGIVREVAFTEGAKVRKGDLLFVIEPDLYERVVSEARAQLARVEAESERAAAYEQRLARLVAADAVSRQDYDNAASAARQAAASVIGARAAVERAELDLGYTRVVATEDGRIGRAWVHVGALVGRDGPTHLATIDQINPVYVNFTISDLDALALRRAVDGGALQTGITRGEVRVLLPDGSLYAEAGKVDFAERQVNADTGTITLRALLPNPRSELLPGMFVRAELDVGVRPGAILLPQKAVIKTPVGHSVWVVVDGQVQRRDLVMGQWLGDRWIVERGLGADEVVVVDGARALSPGAAVKIVPAGLAAPAATPVAPVAAPAAK
jgi:membrane fusion protein (multidrug efflux system)